MTTSGPAPAATSRVTRAPIRSESKSAPQCARIVSTLSLAEAVPPSVVVVSSAGVSAPPVRRRVRRRVR